LKVYFDIPVDNVVGMAKIEGVRDGQNYLGD